MEFIDDDGRYYYHYSFWECWKNGLYSNLRKDQEKIDQSKIILKSVELCDNWFSKVVSLWPVSAKVHLSNKSINRQAWLGHASFCLAHGANEAEGIAAWWMLSTEEQVRANSIADYYITKFEKEFMKDAKKIFGKKCFYRCDRTYCMDV